VRNFILKDKKKEEEEKKKGGLSKPQGSN